MALTVKDLEARGLLTELARVFRSEDQADGLLWSIGMPPERLPSFRAAGNPYNFWRTATQEIENGMTAGGLEALLAAAAKQFPHNQLFSSWDWSSGAPTKPPDPSGGGGPTAPQPTGFGAPPPQPEEGRTRVFLCHANEDKPRVKPLYKRLKADGLQPWIDVVDLLPGQIWAEEIQRVLRRSHAVIVCLSRRSVEKSGYVQREIRMALDILDEQPEGRIFLIPARLEECTIPQRLAHLHWVDLFPEEGYEEGYEKLLAALRAHRVEP